MGGPLYSLVRLTCNTIYPAYASFKAVKSKNVRDYVKWMMYWIVFAFFSSLETLVDPFLIFWFPFYSEIKILLLLYLVSPVTKGSGIIYRRFLHPLLCSKEDEIDAVLSRAKEQGYQKISSYMTKGLTWLASTLLATAIKGGGSVLQQIRRSTSLLDIADLAELAFRDEGRFQDVTDQDGPGDRRSSSSKLRRRQLRNDDLTLRQPLQRSVGLIGSAESLSSGYCSDSFLPVDEDTMDTQDYELWDRRQQVRSTPKSSRKTRHAQDLMSDEDDYPYEAVHTPFGPLKRSGQDSGAVSPDVCSSYYPSDSEDDIQDYPPPQKGYSAPAPERRYSPRLQRRMAEFHTQPTGRSSPLQQQKHSPDHRRPADALVRDSDASTDASTRGTGTAANAPFQNRQTPRLTRQNSQIGRSSKETAAVSELQRTDLTLEELQEAARQLNVSLVMKEESSVPLPPKRVFRSGPDLERKGIESPDLDACSNTTFADSNTSEQPQVPTLPDQETITDKLETETNVIGQQLGKAGEDIKPSNRSSIYYESQEQFTDGKNVIEHKSTLILEQNSSEGEAIENVKSSTVDENVGKPEMTMDQLYDTSDSEYFEPDEEQMKDQEVPNSNQSTSKEELSTGRDVEEGNKKKVVECIERKHENVENLLDQKESPMSFEQNEDESSDDETLNTVIQMAEKDTTRNMTESDEIKDRKTSVAEDSTDVEQIGSKVRSVKKSRAPPPPQPKKAATNPFLAEDDDTTDTVDEVKDTPRRRERTIVKIGGDDSSSVISSEPKRTEGRILYQSPGFNDDIPLSSPTGYPAIRNSPPLSPDLRLKRSLSPLVGEPDAVADEQALDGPQQLIKERPVPFAAPTAQTKLLTSTQGFTRVRTIPLDEARLDDLEDREIEVDNPPAVTSRCPHCTIHNWLPHSPSCPKIKKN